MEKQSFPRKGVFSQWAIITPLGSTLTISPPLLDVLCQTQWSGISQPPSRLCPWAAKPRDVHKEPAGWRPTAQTVDSPPGGWSGPIQPVLTTAHLLSTWCWLQSGKGVGSDGQPPQLLPSRTSILVTALPSWGLLLVLNTQLCLDERLKAFAPHHSGLSEHPHHFKQ